jgi:hypothetical protein
MLLTETEFHQKMRNIKFLIYFTFPQASLPSMSAQMRWVRGIGVTTVGRHGSQFFALIAPHPEIGGTEIGRGVCLRMSSATRRRRASKRPRVCHYSVSRSAYALWPPLRLWPSSPARHFNNIARRLMGRRAISTERVPALAAGRATQV